MPADSPRYYLMREEQERKAAAAAVTDAIRQIHETLADRYRDLARTAEKNAPDRDER